MYRLKRLRTINNSPGRMIFIEVRISRGLYPNLLIGFQIIYKQDKV
jgi:hypothetical protein